MDKKAQEIRTSIWKREDRRERWTRWLRRGLGVALLIATYPWRGLFQSCLALLACILFAPDMAEYISSHVSRWAGHLIWPHREGKPRPIYGYAVSRAAKGKYVEAEIEYDKIIKAFPDEVKPHIDLIDIAVVRLNNAELAEKFYQRGMEMLKEPAGREALTKMYKGIQTRIKPGSGS